MTKVLAGLALAMLCVVSAEARLTGTNPTGSSADAFCVGKAAAEVCVDSSGNVVPTTTDSAGLGSSSLEWNTAAIKTATLGSGNHSVGGSLLKTIPTAVTVTANMAIDPTVGCGGLVILTTANGAITANAVTTFITASSSNKGCVANLINLGVGAITLNTVANFTAGPANQGALVLNTNSILTVGSIGTKWIYFGTMAANQ